MPLALSFEAGGGKHFKEEMMKLVANVKRELHKLFQSYPILFGMIELVQGYNLYFDDIHYLKSLNHKHLVYIQ